MKETESAGANCPPEVLALIPWYPDGPLSSAERGAVEAHAASCAACRQEIQSLLEEEVSSDPPTTQAARVLDRVLGRIEATEASDALRRSAPLRSMPPAGLRAAPPRRRLARVAGLALAAGIGAVAALSAPALLERISYRTATSEESLQPGGPLIEMIPREELSVAEFRAALRRIEGEVIGGPLGMHGRYRVRLPVGSDPAAVAKQLRSEDGGIATYAEALQL